MATRQSSRIAVKRRVSEEILSPPFQPKPCKIRKTSAEFNREWREWMRANNPEEYTEYKDKRNQMCKDYRKNSTEEMKVKQREQAKLRMKIMRAQKKEQKERRVEKPKLKRAVQDDQRGKWRQEKQMQQKKMTAQKRRRINERRRRQYQEKKLAAQAKTPKNTPSQQEQSEPSPSLLRTPCARRKALSRARFAISKSPRKFVQTVTDLVNKASPRKAAAFTTRHLNPGHRDEDERRVGREVISNVKLLRGRRSAAECHVRRVLLSVCKRSTSISTATANLGISRRTATKMGNFTMSPMAKKMKKERKMEAEATSFLEMASTPLPDRKLVSKKTGKGARVLAKPMQELHREFCEEAERSISFSHFSKCRPQHVRPMRQNQLRQCLCEYCTNAELKLRVLNGIACRINNNCRIRHIYHAVDLVTCGRQEGAWQKDCAYRVCNTCSANTLDAYLQPLLQHRRSVSWTKWENQQSVCNGKKVCRKMLSKKQGTMAELVGELKEEIIFLGQHLFRAHWQHQQFEAMRIQTPFPHNTVGMVLDFAENFTCSYQDEVQAAHWYHEQVTVHPIVTYYACPFCEETVSESLIFISDDKQHNFDAVFTFTKVAMDHLRQRGIQIEHVIQWTDGCASQYKSKGPFADISCALVDFDCTWERNYFGSRHGKGPSDGESAVIKHHAFTAIKTGSTTITGPKDLYDYCVDSRLNKQPEDGRCKHFLRSFFWVPKEDISRNRNRGVKTLKGTRSLHAVKCVNQNVLVTRELSCFCSPCQADAGACETIHITGEWKRQILCPIF